MTPATELVDPVSPDETVPPNFSGPFTIVDDFLAGDEAERMRREIDRHFAEPYTHRPDSHQIWNYWHVPGLYTYMRTSPEHVIERALVDRFHKALTAWAKQRLGLGNVTWPILSLYVDGCEQKLHNDATNGRFGFVYSLTRENRNTTGGETIVLKEGDLFRANMTCPNAGEGLFDLIEPRFNRLSLFDDRMPHGVSRLEGSMDPVEGRFVLHGHISESGPTVEGGLKGGEVVAVVRDDLASLLSEVRQMPVMHHGPLVLRWTIEPDGTVSRVDTLVDRLARADGASVADLVERILGIVRSMRFPGAPQSTVATVPLLFGGRLAWLSNP